MSTPFAHAFEWARRQVDSGALPTAVLGVATASGIETVDAFGATGTRKARVEDHFRLFSVTKPLVGLASARMIEAGLATTETPLQEDVPEFGHNRDDVVTLGHLASHRSGIAEPPMDTGEGLEAGLLGPRDFVAGSAARYSTIAFEGIARMIHARTGRTWDAAVADMLDPLGATGLTLDEASDPHDIADAAEDGVDLQQFAALRQPGAGLLGRAEDLLRVGAALLRDAGEIVRPATLAMMRRPLTTGVPRWDPDAVDTGQDWGFTWNLRPRAPGLIDRDLYGHSGWSGAEFYVHPTVGVAYVLLTNRAIHPGVNVDELDNAIVSGV